MGPARARPRSTAPQPAAARAARRAPGPTPAAGFAPPALELQTTVGNRRTAALLRAPRDTSGWQGATGANAGAGTIGKIRRIPVQDLKLGNQRAFADTVQQFNKKTGEFDTVKTAERAKTKESAAGRAIVMVPTGFRPDQPADVLLHFHGWGWRGGDPFAGWREGAKGDANEGEVRDVDHDKLEAQLEAGGTAQTIGVLPQGVGMSDFGKIPTQPYLEEVMAKVTSLQDGVALPEGITKIEVGRVILSGHSGGGSDVISAATAMDASAPGKVAEVILFEAIHGDESRGDLKTIIGWAKGHLDRTRTKLLAATTPKERSDAVAACPVLRAYASKGGGYAGTYTKLEKALATWFRDHGQDLGAEATALRDRFDVRIISGTVHETVVRGVGDDPALGPMADALADLRDPSRANPAEVGVRPSPTLPASKAKKVRAKAKAKPTTKAKAPKPAKAAEATTAPPAGATTTAALVPVSAPVAGTNVGSKVGASVGSGFDPAAVLPIVQALGLPTLGLAAVLPVLLLGGDPLRVVADVVVAAGLRDEIELTDVLFQLTHPTLGGGRIPEGRDDLVREWVDLRRRYAKAALSSGGEAPQGPVAPKADPSPSVPSKGGSTTGTMSEAKRKQLIEAALTQATTAGAAADRDAIAETIAANGSTVAAWFAGIVPDATFLGRTIRASGGKAPGVHKELHDALGRAEARLLANHPGSTAAELGQRFGLRDIGGVRPPKKATGGTLPSYHCFGLAIDINASTNPFVGNKKPSDKKSPRYEEFSQNRSPRIIERAMLLLHGKAFDVEKTVKTTKGASDVEAAGQVWEAHHEASEALAAYLRLAAAPDSAELAAKVAALQAKGDRHDLAWWQQRMATDAAQLPNWDFMRHADPSQGGYMDLDKELVEALVGAGLTWGGQYRKEKDIMHFDLRGGTIQRPT